LSGEPEANVLDSLTVPALLRALRAPVLVLLLALLAACGDGSTAAGDGERDTAAKGDGSAFPRTVEHVAGTTEIDAAPERVVVLDDYTDLDHLVALGVTPRAYGFTDAWETGLTPWQEAAGLGELEQLDATSQVSLELVAAEQPDLILGMESPVEDEFDQLSAIAPTVGLAWNGEWRDDLRTVAAAVGRDDRAEELIAEVEDAIGSLAEELAPLADTTIMIGSMFGDVLYLQGDGSPLVRLLRELGLTVKTTTTEALAELSLEQMDQLADAEILLSFATDPAATKALQGEALFQRLPAVQAGRYTAIDNVDTRSLADGFGPLSHEHALAVLRQILPATGEGRGTPLS